MGWVRWLGLGLGVGVWIRVRVWVTVRGSKGKRSGGKKSYTPLYYSTPHYTIVHPIIL